MTDPPHPRLARQGLAAGLAAAGATMAGAALARGLDVPLEAGSGEEIPVLGFGQLTLFFTAIGVLIAHLLRSRAARPRALRRRTARLEADRAAVRPRRGTRDCGSRAGQGELG
jgi:Family of unknown function (DUF6069)